MHPSVAVLCYGHCMIDSLLIYVFIYFCFFFSPAGYSSLQSADFWNFWDKVCRGKSSFSVSESHEFIPCHQDMWPRWPPVVLCSLRIFTIFLPPLTSLNQQHLLIGGIRSPSLQASTGWSLYRPAIEVISLEVAHIVHPISFTQLSPHKIVWLVLAFASHQCSSSILDLLYSWREKKEVLLKYIYFPSRAQSH